MIVYRRKNRVLYYNPTIDSKINPILGASDKRLEEEFPNLEDDSFLILKPEKVSEKPSSVSGKGICFNTNVDGYKLCLNRTTDIIKLRRINFIPRRDKWDVLKLYQRKYGGSEI